MFVLTFLKNSSALTCPEVEGEASAAAAGLPHREENERHVQMVRGHEEHRIAGAQAATPQHRRRDAHGAQQLDVRQRPARRRVRLRNRGG